MCVCVYIYIYIYIYIYYYAKVYTLSTSVNTYKKLYERFLGFEILCFPWVFKGTLLSQNEKKIFLTIL